MSIETNNKLVGKLGSSNIKGSGISVKGETGNGIDRIEKTNSVGLIDTYTIYFTDGNTTTFTITNGKNGIDGVNGTNGENGKSLQFNWNGTQLGIRTEGSTEYTYVDLKGNKGDKGDKGDPGEVTLEQLNNATKTTQTTEVSEELTIEDCAGVGAKLDIKSGKSEQATRSGKNLYNPTSEQSTVADLTLSGDLQNIYINGTATSADVKFHFGHTRLSAGTYTITLELSNGTIDCPYLSFYLYKYNTWKRYGNFNFSNTLTRKSFTFTLTEEVDISLSLYVKATDSASNVKMKCQIVKGETADFEFEPYGVMPSPDYPSRIRNVGDNINEFDGELEIGSISTTDGQNSVNANCLRSKNFQKVNPSENYVLSNDKNYGYVYYLYDKDYTFIKALNQSNILSLTEDTQYIKFRSIPGNTENDLNVKYKLEKGKVATPYTPYNCGSADFKVENKNKCKIEISTKVSATATIQDDRIIMKPTVTTGVSYIVLSYREFEIGKKYTVSFKTEGNYRMGGLFSGPYKLDKSWYTKTYSFTLQEGDNTNLALGFYINNSSLNNELTIYDIQIEEGNIVTDYIPHQEQIKSFPFTEGQVLHKGDYLASNGIHQKRTTLILDGTENITYDANTNVFTISAVNDIALENGFNASARNIIISNYFKGSNWYRLYNKLIDNAISGHNSAKVVKIRTTEFTSVDEFKTFLTTQYANGTPVTIEYELAEEIVIPYTEEQEQAYYELQHLLMYEGYTSIECIDEIKPDIQLTYWYNNELNKSYGERFDKVEDSINELDNRDVYSIEEQVIGKWIDGKPLYRRAIIFNKTSFEVNAYNEYNLPYNNDDFWNTLDLAMIDKSHSYIICGDGGVRTFVNGLSGVNNELWWFDIRSYSKTSKTIQMCIGSSILNKTYWEITVTLEYTKTTD